MDKHVEISAIPPPCKVKALHSWNSFMHIGGLVFIFCDVLRDWRGCCSSGSFITADRDFFLQRTKSTGGVALWKRNMFNFVLRFGSPPLSNCECLS